MKNVSGTSGGARESRTRKRPRGAPTHVVEFPLIVTEADRHKLETRFKAAGILRNICIEEALRRLDSMRSDPRWAAARAMPKGDERTEAFVAIKLAFGFTKASMESFARGSRDSFWIRDHLGGHDTQVVAATIFDTARRWMFGKGGKPRFKRVSTMRSIASKDARNFMRLKGDLAAGPGSYRFEFRGLALRIRRRAFSASEIHSLSMPALSFRVVHHKDGVRGRYALQVVVDGPARIHRNRAEPGAARAAIDIGPSTIAIVTTWLDASGRAVGEPVASLQRFCDGVDPAWAETRRAQRAVDRSFRAANPDCFRPNGTFINGKKARGRSETLIRRRAKLRKAEAKAARRRRNEHGQLTNVILAQASIVHAEALSHKAFQKSFGRSVGARAPGLFMETLRRKAEAVGGGIVPIPTRASKLSQFDHAARDCVRKPLSLRRHAMRDGSGIVVQRDLYSAFLALHCDASGVVDVEAASLHWRTGACRRLVAASAQAEAESARRRRSAPTRGRAPRGAVRPRSRSQRRSQPLPGEVVPRGWSLEDKLRPPSEIRESHRIW